MNVSQDRIEALRDYLKTPSPLASRLLEKITAWVSRQADLADQGLRASSDLEAEAWFRGRMVALSEAERFIKQATAEESSEVAPCPNCKGAILCEDCCAF